MWPESLSTAQPSGTCASSGHPASVPLRPGSAHHCFNLVAGRWRGLTVACVNKEDRSHFAELLRALDESDTWAARIGPGAERLRPAPRSPLWGDDDRAHPYELSHAAWHSLSH